MARKHFCDGCDREIVQFGTDLGQQMKVVVEDEAKDKTLVARSLHMCRACAARLCDQADPGKWVRVGPAPRST